MLASMLDVSMLAAMLPLMEPGQLLGQNIPVLMMLRGPTNLPQQKVSTNQLQMGQPMLSKALLKHMGHKGRGRRRAKKAPMPVSRRLEMLVRPKNLLLVSCHHNHTHLMPLARHILLLVRSLRRVGRFVQRRKGGRV